MREDNTNPEHRFLQYAKEIEALEHEKQAAKQLKDQNAQLASKAEAAKQLRDLNAGLALKVLHLKSSIHLRKPRAEKTF